MLKFFHNMNPLHKEISTLLQQQSFSIRMVDSANIRISPAKGGFIDSHCMNSVNQLALLIHGVEEGMRVILTIRFTSDIEIDCTDIESGLIIKIGTVIRDYLEIKAQSTAKDIKDQVIEQFKTHLKLSQRKALGFSVLDFGYNLRRKQFRSLKTTVMTNENRLSEKTAFMYYVLIRFDPFETEYNVHAFALQQQYGGEYALWHSWFHEFTLLEEKGYQTLYKRSIETLLNDLIAIFHRRRWDMVSKSLWEKWFNVPVYSTLNQPLDLIQFEGSSFSLDSTSMCFTTASYDPVTIQKTVQGHFKQLNELADHSLLLDRRAEGSSQI